MFVCVCVALVMQHAKRIRLVLSSVAKSGSTTFFHIIAQTVQFSKKKRYCMQSVFRFSLQLLPEKFLILRRIQLYSVINVHTSS
jgi:hypothetical protein